MFSFETRPAINRSVRHTHTRTGSNNFPAETLLTLVRKTLIFARRNHHHHHHRRPQTEQSFDPLIMSGCEAFHFRECGIITRVLKPQPFSILHHHFQTASIQVNRSSRCTFIEHQGRMQFWTFAFCVFSTVFTMLAHESNKAVEYLQAINLVWSDEAGKVGKWSRLSCRPRAQ